MNCSDCSNNKICQTHVMCDNFDIAFTRKELLSMMAAALDKVKIKLAIEQTYHLKMI